MIEIKLRTGLRRPSLGIFGSLDLGMEQILRKMGACRSQPDPRLSPPFDEFAHYYVPMPMAVRLFTQSKDISKWRQPPFMKQWQNAIGRRSNGLLIDRDAYEYFRRWLDAEKEIKLIKEGDERAIWDVLNRHGITDQFFAARAPMPHQMAGLAFFLVSFELDAGHILFFDEMRTGKTKQAVDISRFLLEHKIIKSVLIIVPNTVKLVWANELIKDAPLLSWLTNIVQGNKAQRRKAWEATGVFWIVNYEALRADYKEVYAWQNNRPSKWMLVVDEAHRLKNPVSLQSKVVLGFKSRKVDEKDYEGLDPDFSIFMTGTPISNSPEDAWSMSNFTCSGILAQNLNWFRVAFAKKGGYGGKQVIGYKNLDEVRWRLARTSMRRTRSMVNFDEAIISPRIGTMQRDQAAAYADMRDMLYAEIMDVDGEMTAVKARNHLARLVRLAQITSGYLSPKPGTETWFKNAGWKITELDSLLMDYLDNLGKVVIWSRFVPPLYFMEDRYSKWKPLLSRGQMGDQAVENMYKFQRDPQYKIMLAQIQTAEGKGFQPATTAIFYDKWWSPYLNQQAADRIVGIENPVTVGIIPLITEGTIDMRIEFLLEQKQDWSDAVTGDLRESEINLPVLDRATLLYMLANPKEARLYEEAITSGEV